MWLPWKPGGNEEAGLKLGRLKPGQGRGPRRLVPWWVGALRRAKAASVMRRQPKTSASGGGLRRRVAPARLYGRGKGGWVRHARYLARERAQHEHDRGRGFDAGSEGLDMAATVREWERADELMWSLIVSPEDAARMNLRGHAHDL